MVKNSDPLLSAYFFVYKKEFRKMKMKYLIPYLVQIRCSLPTTMTVMVNCDY
jgi:hypothetical protein